MKTGNLVRADMWGPTFSTRGPQASPFGAGGGGGVSGGLESETDYLHPAHDADEYDTEELAL